MSTTYVDAASVEEAIAALASGARPVAGGTDLVVGARQGKRPLPEALVGIHRISSLRGICLDEDVLHIGALTTHDEIVANDSVRKFATGLADASAIVGSHATRAHGTIGGNVMNASPAMDTGAPLLCLGARIVLQSVGGVRTVPLDEFFVSPGRTVANPDELAIGIEIPTAGAGSGSCYARLEYRRQMEIAVVGAAASVSFDGEKISSAKVAITALTPTIRLIPAAQAILVGSTGDRAAVDAAAAAMAEAATPISDVRASAQYRKAMAAVIARRAIESAIARAKGLEVAIPASASTQGSY